MEKTKLGMNENIEAALAYSFPPFAGISGFIMLILEPENKLVRFHAMQSFIVFVLFGVTTAAFSFLPFIGRPLAGIIGMVTFLSWLMLIISAFTGKYAKFPIIGEIVYNRIVG